MLYNNKMRRLSIITVHVLLTIAWLGVARICAAERPSRATPRATAAAKDAAKFPKGFEVRSAEGWTVLVDPRLRRDQNTQTDRALALLQEQLRMIVSRLPPWAVGKLRSVPLWMSPTEPGQTPRAAYHPSAQWLKEHGHDPAKAKGVEFTNIGIFEQEVKRMPVFVLHELAHAYHDQVLGFENPEINAAYERAVASKSYDAVKRSNGKIERSYAMTNAKEYFAETSEAFFGENDFYPFNRTELEQHDPEMFRLLGKLWRAAGSSQPAIRGGRK